VHDKKKPHRRRVKKKEWARKWGKTKTQGENKRSERRGLDERDSSSLGENLDQWVNGGP